jgi:hypothetical protein
LIGVVVVLVSVSLMLPELLLATWEIPATAARLHANDEVGVALAGL